MSTTVAPSRSPDQHCATLAVASDRALRPACVVEQVERKEEDIDTD